MATVVRGIATLLLVGLLVSAGCLGVITGEEPLVVTAEPGTVSAAAQADAGYEEVRRTTQELTRTVSAAGQSREVQVTNHINEYSRSVTIDPFGTAELARFVVVTTPAVEVLGLTFNPVGDMSNRELVELVQEEYQGLEDIQPAAERQTTVLGTATTVATFTADARVQDPDFTVELTIHVTRVRHEGDFAVAIAVHPALLQRETRRVDTMLRGIQHATG